MFGSAAGRVEHGVGLERAAVAEDDARRAVARRPRARAPSRRRAMSTPFLRHLGGDEVADVAIEAAQDLLAAIELRHAARRGR